MKVLSSRKREHFHCRRRVVGDSCGYAINNLIYGYLQSDAIDADSGALQMVGVVATLVDGYATQTTKSLPRTP